MKEARLNCKCVIAKAKVVYWRNYLNENVLNYRDNKVLYKHLKHIKQRYCPAERPLNSNGTKTKSSLEKAKVLADVFAKASRTENLTESSRRFHEKADKERSDPAIKQGCPLNRNFSLTELTQCIKKHKK